MEKDKEITEIIFRTGINGISKGETFAIFPYYVYNWRGNVMSFTPFEGHGEAEYEFCIRKVGQPQSKKNGQFYNV